MKIITFVNVSQDKASSFETIASDSLDRTIETFSFWMDNGTEEESSSVANLAQDDLVSMLESGDIDQDEYDEKVSILKGFCYLGSFYEYGLSFDFVEADEKHDAYYRYQLSWGGPSDEIRFHLDGSVEYVYMDWFCGIGFDVSREPVMQWLKQFFLDCMSIDFESKDSEELYSDYFQDDEE